MVSPSFLRRAGWPERFSMFAQFGSPHFSTTRAPFNKNIFQLAGTLSGSRGSSRGAEKSKIATESQSHREGKDSESIRNANKLLPSLFSSFSVSPCLCGYAWFFISLLDLRYVSSRGKKQLH